MKRFIILAILLGVIFIKSELKLVSQSVDYYVRVSQKTNIRSEPDHESDNILTSIPAGSTLRVTYEGINGNWLQVVYEGVQGWMARWISHSRVSAPVQAANPSYVPTPTSVPPSNISIRGETDNKCKDWGWPRCETEQAWRQGYYAKEREKCGLPIDPRGIYEPYKCDSPQIESQSESLKLSGNGNKVKGSVWFPEGTYLSTFTTRNTGYGYGFGAVKVFGDCFRWLNYNLVHNVSRAGRHEKVFIIDYSCDAFVEISNSRGRWTLIFELQSD